MEHIYIDGIENLASIAGNVHVDFFRYTLNGVTETERNRETHMHMVMSPEGFMRCHKAINELYDQFVEKGIFQEQPSEETPV